MTEPQTPATPVSQLLAEAASALHSVDRSDGREWTTLTEAEKVPYIARVIPVVFAVLMTTRPPGWSQLTAQVLVVGEAVRGYPGEGTQ